MTYFDYFVIAVMAISLLLGLWRGMIGEIIALTAWVLGFIAAREWGGELAGAFLTRIADPSARLLIAWMLIFIAVLALMALLRLLLRGLLKALGLTITDRLLGLFFGLMRGALILLILVAAGGMTPLPQEPWWRGAQFAPPLETAVLMGRPWLPPEVAKRIQFR